MLEALRAAKESLHSLAVPPAGEASIPPKEAESKDQEHAVLSCHLHGLGLTSKVLILQSFSWSAFKKCSAALGPLYSTGGSV